MNATLKTVIAASLLASGSALASADVLYESATLGTVGQGGGYSLSEQILGSRFTLTQDATVTRIGGHMTNSSGTLGAAIIKMDGLLPQGLPLNPDEIMAEATFSACSPSCDYMFDFDVFLPAGDYAILFSGAPHFGATGSGAMPFPNPNTNLGTGSYFFWNYSGNNWSNGGFDTCRFVVEGDFGGGGIDLAFSGNCPGTGTFDVTGATPNGNVALVYGFGAGPTTIPNTFPCAGTVLNVGNPNLDNRVISADANGNATLSTFIPTVACGAVNVQALDVTSCAVSNVVTP